MKSGDAQKSEVHPTTADADGSPTSKGDERKTLEKTTHEHGPDHPPRKPSPLTPGTHVVKDDTDLGGPLVIESDDPELSPPKVPQDPFPTDRTPEIDPPIKE